MGLDTSDYHTVLESLNQLELGEWISRLTSDLKTLTLQVAMQQLSSSLKPVIPCITDAYSLLRYSLYILLANPTSLSIKSPKHVGSIDIGQASISETRNQLFLRGDGTLEELIESSHRTIDRFLALMSFCRERPKDYDTERLQGLLLKLQGESPYIDALISLIQRAVQEPELRRRQAAEVKASGITLVQCAFYGDLTQPGVSSGGGIGTFLRELGDYLGTREDFKEVYTLNLLSQDEGSSKPLVQELGKKHTLIRVPVPFKIHDEPFDFMKNEFEINHAVRHTLEQYSIDPDIFHIRYTDNASKSILNLAKELGKRIVFTLTPDPHKTFMQDSEQYRRMNEDELLRNLNKVFIADLLIGQVDGLLLIGYGDKNSQVLPYFPHLLLDEDIRKKPLKIVGEGVRPEFQLTQDDDACIYPDLLTTHDGQQLLGAAFVNRPLILNVGRLHPLKGQHNLVKAWIESPLNQLYNLVLVGGNLDDPNPTETAIIEQIDALLDNAPDLKGQFSHVPAIENPKVRLLEQSIITSIQADLPNLYLCSSFKEEFGISILEGMAAGFLVLAPQRGGVSDYIKNEVNGFLIRTDNAETIREDAEDIIQAYECKTLHDIALRGKKFAREKLDIRTIGKDYSKFYIELLHHE